MTKIPPKRKIDQNTLENLKNMMKIPPKHKN